MGNAAATKKRRPLPVHNDDVTTELPIAENKITSTSLDSVEDKPNSDENMQIIIEELPNLHRRIILTNKIATPSLTTSDHWADTLKYIGDIVKSMRSHKAADTVKNTMNLSVLKSLKDLDEFYYKYESHRQLIGDELVNTGAGIELYEYMRIITGNEKDYPRFGYRHDCYELLRKICMNFTNDSSKLCKEFSRVGLLAIMLCDLKNFQNDFCDNMTSYNIAFSAMTILYNCARTGDNTKHFRAINAVDLVTWYSRNSDRSMQKQFLLPNKHVPLSAMTLAYIVGDKSDDVILAGGAFLSFYLEMSLRAQDHCIEGYSASELTNCLTKLSSNAENSIAIVNNGVLKSLAKLLQEGNEIEQTAAAKAIWVLSFVNANKNAINKDTKIVAKLKSILASCSSSNLKQATNGALWMLKHDLTTEDKNEQEKAKQEQEAKQENTTNDSTSGHLMISYQWDCQKLMTKLKSRLEEMKYKVWMDLDEMNVSTLESMAEGVKDSYVVFVCIGQKYKDSIRCRTEAEYAYKLGKTVIPIQIEEDYEADGWLGAILGTRYCYDMSNLTMIDQVFPNLVKKLGDTRKIQQQKLQLVTLVKNMSKEKRLKDWSIEDVKKWTRENNIENMKNQSLDGNVLLYLKNLKQVAPEFFYSYVTNELGLKHIRDVMVFDQGIAQLN